MNTNSGVGDTTMHFMEFRTWIWLQVSVYNICVFIFSVLFRVIALGLGHTN